MRGYDLATSRNLRHYVGDSRRQKTHTRELMSLLFTEITGNPRDLKSEEEERGKSSRDTVALLTPRSERRQEVTRKKTLTRGDYGTGADSLAAFFAQNKQGRGWHPPYGISRTST